MSVKYSRASGNPQPTLFPFEIEILSQYLYYCFVKLILRQTCASAHNSAFRPQLATHRSAPTRQYTVDGVLDLEKILLIRS